MTNKQTIDGVPLSLLKRLAASEDLYNRDQAEAVVELRALLAANPEQSGPCPECGGSLITWGCTCTPRWPMYKPAPQPQGEVERLRAELSKSNAAHEAAAQHQGELNTRIFQLERTRAEQDALLRDARRCVIEAADPEAGGPTQREAQSVLDRIDAILSASAEPKPRGEPVANAKPVAKLHAERLTGKDGEYGVTVEDSEWFNTCRLTGGIFNLYAEQPAPVAIEAAKAFAKGFNTLESGGGKHRISMQFQSREDAWGAFNVLAHLKQLNTPQ